MSLKNSLQKSESKSLFDPSHPFHSLPGGTSPACLVHPAGSGPILLICEHASNRIPKEFDGLGLSDSAKESHVAWDPGAYAVAQHLTALLDAQLVVSTVSRLVYDCNRPPEAPGAMPAVSELFDIPGNVELSTDERAGRTHLYYHPFRDLLAETIAAAPAPVLVTIHSFTGTYRQIHRDVELGILHDSDSQLADHMLALAPAHTNLNVQRNQPYGPEHGVTHTLKEHGIRNGLCNVMLEIRNDLIDTESKQREMAQMLASLLQASLAKLPTPQDKETDMVKADRPFHCGK